MRALGVAVGALALCGCADALYWPEPSAGKRISPMVAGQIPLQARQRAAEPSTGPSAGQPVQAVAVYPEVSQRISPALSPLARSIDDPGAAPGNYRALIADRMRLKPAEALRGAQVSELRTTSGPQLGQWMACVRTAGERPAYFAVFIDNGTVLDYRRAVALDRCEAGTFSPLPPPRQRPVSDDDPEAAPDPAK